MSTTDQCLEAARKFYANRPFVRVVENPPHTKWATGSNLVYVSYAADQEPEPSSPSAPSTTSAKALLAKPSKTRI